MKYCRCKCSCGFYPPDTQLTALYSKMFSEENISNLDIGNERNDSINNAMQQIRFYVLLYLDQNTIFDNTKSKFAEMVLLNQNLSKKWFLKFYNIHIGLMIRFQ